jgi:hypothetical protein
VRTPVSGGVHTVCEHLFQEVFTLTVDRFGREAALCERRRRSPLRKKFWLLKTQLAFCLYFFDLSPELITCTASQNTVFEINTFV